MGVWPFGMRRNVTRMKYCLWPPMITTSTKVSIWKSFTGTGWHATEQSSSYFLLVVGEIASQLKFLVLTADFTKSENIVIVDQ